MEGNNVVYEACPCPAFCPRHGDCAACRTFHYDKGQSTYCEKEKAKMAAEDGLIRDGRTIQLMDYGPCAG